MIFIFIYYIMNEILKNIYYDVKTGFISKDKLYKKAREVDDNITLKIVQNFLDNQATYQITKQTKKPKVYDTIISPKIKNNYQIDLFTLPNPTLNKNFKYLLTCIDVYSRYVFVEKLKNKLGETVLEAFKKIIERAGKPNNINADMGTEFIYSSFQNYCLINNIKIWYSNPEQDNKNAIIERFHRTLRNYILKYEVANGKEYITELDDIIDNYNNTFHNTIKTEPVKIWKGIDINEQNIKVLKSDFKEGDKVRHLIHKNKKVFDKNSSTTSYTKKVYTITKVIGRGFFLDDLQKPFRQHELVSAKGDDLNVEYDNKIKNSSAGERRKRRLKKAGFDS